MDKDIYNISGLFLLKSLDSRLKFNTQISILEILGIFSVIESYFTFIIYSNANINVWGNNIMKRLFDEKFNKSTFGNYDNLYEIVFGIKLSEFKSYTKLKEHFKKRNKITHGEFSFKIERNGTEEIKRESIIDFLKSEKKCQKYFLEILDDFSKLLVEIEEHKRFSKNITIESVYIHDAIQKGILEINKKPCTTK